MTLDFTTLQNALNTLHETLVLIDQDPHNTIIRDATIQRFEYCYELTHKMLRRYLRTSEPSSEEVNEMPFADLIRLASARGLLLSDWSVWQTYRAARNITSHTYDEDEAMKVIRIVPQFYDDALYFVNHLTRR